MVNRKYTSAYKVIYLNEAKRNKQRKKIEAMYVAFYGNSWAKGAGV